MTTQTEDKAPKKTVIVVSESFRASAANDAFMFATIVSLIGIGVLLDSSAMQWIGGLLGMITISVRAAGKTKPMTIAEARAKLDELEAAGREG